MTATPSADQTPPAQTIESSDERIQRIPMWKKALSRPELGALAGTVLVLAFLLSPPGVPACLPLQAFSTFLKCPLSWGLSRPLRRY